MTWNTLDNLATGQLVTETHLDQMRENVEHLGAMQFADIALSALAAGISAARVAVGSYTGNGGDNRAITGVGFTPKTVRIKRSGAANEVLRYGMAGDLASDVTGAAIANLIQSLDSDGFTVGSDALVNANAATLYWMAIG